MPSIKLLTGQFLVGFSSKELIFSSQTPLLTPDFYGRSAELEQLNLHLRPGDRGRAAVVLWGLSGQGKTQLALRFQQLFGYKYTSKLWVDATSFDTLLESFTEIALVVDESNTTSKIASFSQLSVSPSSKAKQIIAIVKSWLERKSNMGWLMVIDSVEDIDSFDIRQVLPACDHGSIIITSTRADTSSVAGMQGIEVAGIDEKAGVEMLLQKINQTLHSDEGK
jgi:hypothetical protein